MANVTIIRPPKLYQIRVSGGMRAAEIAVAKWLGAGNPMLPGANVNGVGGVHAEVWADRAVLEAWFCSEHRISVPGVLLWYQSVD